MSTWAVWEDHWILDSIHDDVQSAAQRVAYCQRNYRGHFEYRIVRNLGRMLHAVAELVENKLEARK